MKRPSATSLGGIVQVGGPPQTHDNRISENLISGNGGGITGAGTEDSGSGLWLADGLRTEIYDNLIGTDVSGTKPLGNAGAGIHITDAQVTYVGGFTKGSPNTIAFNGGDGVLMTVFASGAERGYIAGNSIHSNGGLGIDFLDDGVTEQRRYGRGHGAERTAELPGADERRRSRTWRTNRAWPRLKFRAR